MGKRRFSPQVVRISCHTYGFRVFFRLVLTYVTIMICIKCKHQRFLFIYNLMNNLAYGYDDRALLIRWAPMIDNDAVDLQTWPIFVGDWNSAVMVTSRLDYGYQRRFGPVSRLKFCSTTFGESKPNRFNKIVLLFLYFIGSGICVVRSLFRYLIFLDEMLSFLLAFVFFFFFYILFQLLL